MFGKNRNQDDQERRNNQLPQGDEMRSRNGYYRQDDYYEDHAQRDVDFQSAQENGYGGQMPGDQGYGGQMPGGQSYGGQMPGGQSYGGQMPGGQSYGGQMPGNQGYGGQMPGNQGYGGQMPGNQGYGYGPESRYGQGNFYGGQGYPYNQNTRQYRQSSPQGGAARRRPDGAARVPQPYREPKKKRRGWLVVLLILLALLAAGGAFLLGNLARIDRTKLGEILTNVGVTRRSGYDTFVLYGVDSRTGELTKDCNSDMIIVCSLNRSTKELRLASVYRDTYLDNTDGSFRKATDCYAVGGPELSVNMLNKNLDLSIDDYVAVNFNSVVKVIDLLGGIELDITDEEMEYINGYCVENQQVTGVGYTPLTTSGYVHLDGIQALAYCRIRYTEGWDFKRTERQRQVLMLTYQKAASQGPVALARIANEMLPNISTSMGTFEIMSLVAGAGSYKIGEQTGFPFNQTPADLSDAGDCVVPVNLAENVKQLHAFLYGDTAYQPSQTVQDISAAIMNNTGIY